jgi:serine/threonine protein kinase
LFSELRYISSEAKQFIQNLLTTDPRQRLSAAACLEHPWLSAEGVVDTLYTLETSWMKQLLARYQFDAV